MFYASFNASLFHFLPWSEGILPKTVELLNHMNVHVTQYQK